jgi:hypothetical protein
MTNREHLYPDQSDVYPATDAEVIRFEVEDKAIATIRLLCAEGVWMQSVSVAFRFGDHAFQVGALTKKPSFPDRLAALSFALGVCLDHFKSEQEWKAVPEPPRSLSKRCQVRCMRSSSATGTTTPRSR